MYIHLFICLNNYLIFLLNQIFRYFDVELGEAQELIKELISEGKWNTNEFPEMKQDLLNKLKIQYN